MKILFGFPGAGAGPNVFRIWKDQLKDEMIFHQISYNSSLKGTGGYCDNMKEAARRSAEEVVSLAGKDDEIWFFGHCMGASVAYETAVLLAQEYDIRIRALFFWAFIAPDVPILDGISHWDDEAFANEIYSHGTFPEEFFVNPSILKLFLPKIRADHKLIEEYCDTEHRQLDCPIVGFFGEEDTIVKPEETAGWANYTSAEYRSILLPGDHYYYYDHQPELIERIRTMIRTPESAETPGEDKGGDMEELIKKTLAEILEDDSMIDSWGPDTDIINDIGIDSLQLTWFLLKLEEELGTPIDYDALQFEDLESIRSLSAFLERTQNQN